MAMPATMTVTKQDVFTHIPKAELRSVLVIGSRKARILDPLSVKLRDLNNDFRDGQNSAYKADGLEM